MILLGFVAAAGVIFAIAAFVIGREARKLDSAPPQPVFDIEEAVAWVADHLPFDVSAVLTYDDVRRIIDWNLEYFLSRGVPSNRSAPHLDGSVASGVPGVVCHVPR